RIPLAKPLCELFADMRLHISQALRLCTFPQLQISRQLNLCGVNGRLDVADLHSGDYTRSIQNPLRDQTIRRHSPVKWASRNSVKIRQVLSRYGTETVQVEVGISRFKRVKCPFDQANRSTERFFPLKKLEHPANAAVAVFGQNARHVRVQ